MNYNQEYFEGLPIIEPEKHFTVSKRDWESIRRFLFWQYGIEADDGVIQAFIENEEHSVWRAHEEEVEEIFVPGERFVRVSYLVEDTLEDDNDRLNSLLEGTPEYWADELPYEYNHCTDHLPYI